MTTSFFKLYENDNVSTHVDNQNLDFIEKTIA